MELSLKVLLQIVLDRADLLALVCDVIVILLLSHLVSLDMFGTFLY